MAKQKSSYKLVLGLLVIISLLSILALGAWFLIVPKFANDYLIKQFSGIEKKLDRKLQFSKLNLHSPRSFSLQQLELSDYQSNERAFICESVFFRLNRVPYKLKGLHVDEVVLEGCKLSLKYKDGNTNFDDIIKLIKPKTPKLESELKEKSALRKIFSPLPSISMPSLSVELEPVKLANNLQLTSLNLSQFIASQDREGVYLANTDIDFEIENAQKRTRYQSHFLAELQNLKKGSLKLSSPKGRNGEIPPFFKFYRSYFNFDTLTLKLPSTLTVDNLIVQQNDADFASAKNARFQFMTLPPKKISGVYFKEVELNDARILINIDNSGNSLTAFINDIKSQFKQTKPQTTQKVEKQKTIEDYFFSQRVFINNADFQIIDQLDEAAPDIHISGIIFELGYRSIRKIVDFTLDYTSVEPLHGTSALAGNYALNSLTGDIFLDVEQNGARANWARGFMTFWDLDFIKKSEKNNHIFESVFGWVYGLQLQIGQLKSETHLSFDIDNKNFKLDGDFEVVSASYIHERISEFPTVFDLKTKISAKYNNNKFELSLEDALINHVPFTFEAMLQKTPSLANDKLFSLNFNIPENEAEKLFEAIPYSLRSDLDGLQLSGKTAFSLRAEGSMSKIQDMLLEFSIPTSPDFSIIRFPANRNIYALNDGFVHSVIDPNALVPHSIRIPPSIYPIIVNGVSTFQPMHTPEEIRQAYPHWVIFEDLNPYLIQLITTTEDGSFFTHKGFSNLQIKAALAKNINSGAFTRGASTITMQLIKNLYFNRNKSIARKFQEALYTWLTESILHIPKQRLMELYFNIIEFGPEIYGIEEAARYYFGKRSADLSLKETAFLMSIIPKPRQGEVHKTRESLDASTEKTCQWFIDEMYRRKCDPQTLEKTRQRYAKRNLPVPFEPCCPSAARLQLLKTQKLSFYNPDPNDPSASPYQPQLYTPEGLAHVAGKRECGFHDEGAVLFEEWFPETNELNAEVP